MSERVNKMNIDTLVQDRNSERALMKEILERLTKTENNIAILHAELANSKQLTAHLLGRGMGSTA